MGNCYFVHWLATKMAMTHIEGWQSKIKKYLCLWLVDNQEQEQHNSIIRQVRMQGEGAMKKKTLPKSNEGKKITKIKKIYKWVKSDEFLRG